MDSERRQALLRAKLAALVRDQWGDLEHTPSVYPGGAALQEAKRGWVLVEEKPERALGGALAWAWRHEVDELHVLVEAAAGLLARRAQLFAPQPVVWHVEGRSLTRATADEYEPEAEVGVEGAVFEDVIRDTGADVVVEHGILRGEVLGLEVGRVVDGRLLAGVGKHDQQAHQLAHPDRPAAEGLAEAVAQVRIYRQPDAGAHPANQLAVERWLRAVVVAHPELIGLEGVALRPVSTAVVRTDLRQAAPAAAIGDGVFVVCSIGVDTDFVPTAADAWAFHGRPSQFLLVVPEGDDHPVTHALAALLAHQAHVVTVPPEWRQTGL
jgi:hypothetical protein